MVVRRTRTRARGAGLRRGRPARMIGARTRAWASGRAAGTAAAPGSAYPDAGVRPLSLRLRCLAAVLAAAALPAAAQPADEALLAAIREEGLQRSQVMRHVGWLSDVYGPRLTGTPAIEEAGAWAMDTLRGWGLSNVRAERFAFGAGWTLERFHAHLVEPQVMPIIGYPKSWSAGTGGTVTAEVVRVDLASEADFERYRGRLRGKIVLTQPVRRVPMLTGDVVLRMDDEQLAAAARPVEPPPAGPRRRPPARGGPAFARQLQQFYLDEGVVAAVDRGSDAVHVGGGSGLPHRTQRTDGGTIFVGRGGAVERGDGGDVGAFAHVRGRALQPDGPAARPGAAGAHGAARRDPLPSRGRGRRGAERLQHPRRDSGPRLRRRGRHARRPLRHDPRLDGGDRQRGRGGRDDGGDAILKTVGARPRRTIRLALWGAEEQGLLGSREYVRRHFGDAVTMALEPAHAKLSAYYNIDNGTGRLRGIWLQGNAAAGAVFEPWAAPLADLGFTTLSPRSVGGTDHVAFERVGLPGFQFIQDRLEYNSRTHHSNMDVVDRVQPDDARQMAVVAAVFAYNTAMLDERLPRKPLPRPRR